MRGPLERSEDDTAGTLPRRSFLSVSGKAALLAGSAGALALVGTRPGSASRERVRLGVVGGNFGASFYFHEHPNCDVVAVTDLRPDRRERLAAAYQCETTYASYEEMLATARDLDAVAIFSEAPAHVAHVKLAAERGLHVLCACPAATSLPECHELRDIVERTGVLYMQAETSWYRPQTIFAREMFAQGGFGELFYTEAEYYHDRGDLVALRENTSTRFWNPDGTPSWRRGFPPLHYPTHATAFLTGVTGEHVTHVSALGWGTDHAFLRDNAYDNPHWNEAALMRTSGGHMLRCNVFWLSGTEGERASWHGDAGAMTMARSWHGDVHEPRMAKAKNIPVPQYWRTERLPVPLRHPSHHGDSATFITAEFIDAIMTQRRPAIDVYDGLALVAPGIVGHASALRGGEQLPVPQFERPAPVPGSVPP